jgi:diacylglycerol kinase (ATP)
MEVASGLRGKNVPLAIMPCGTANVMSIELGIPPDLTESIALIAEGRNRLRYVDMGAVGNHDFLLRVGVGLEAYMVKETPREAKSRWGNLAYAFTALNERNNHPVSRYTLNLDGLHVEVEGISLMIANSGNVGIPGVFIAPGIDVSDGLLDAIIIRYSDLPSLLAIATNALLNREDDADPILHWQAKKISVLVEPEQPVQADGEIIDPTPLVAEVVPGAVAILCPLPVADEVEPRVQPPGLV